MQQSSKLNIDKERVELHLSSGKLISKKLDQLTSFYLVIVGSDVFANDSTCYFLEFDDQVWLIPEDTKGVYQLKTWLPTLEASNRSSVVQMDHLPFKWRKKVLFFFGTEPQLNILTMDEFLTTKEKLRALPGKKALDYF